MYFILILFFASLFSITLMIGRKLLMLQNGQIIPKDFAEEVAFKTLEEWKKLAIKSIKRHSYNALVAIMRFYFRAAALLKNKYKEIKIAVKSTRKKNAIELEKREMSKFLKVISEYKKKIRKIKQKVKEEENL